MRYPPTRLVLVCAVLFPSVLAAAPETHTFDKSHTHIHFAIQHLGISTFLGQFNEFDGKIVFDPESPSNSSVEVTIDMTSVDTDVPALDKHLKSPDFFEAEKFPQATFKSTKVRQVSKDTFRISGNLTMRGQTRPVDLDARLNFTGKHPLAEVFPDKYNAFYRGFSATTSILRSDFGMDYAAPALADRVELRFEVEARRPLE